MRKTVLEYVLEYSPTFLAARYTIIGFGKFTMYSQRSRANESRQEDGRAQEE